MADERNKISNKSIKPALNSVELLVDSSMLMQRPSEAISSPDNVQDWTETHVHEWLCKNDLPQMARILSGMDGLGLIYFSEHMLQSESQQVLLSLQQDSLRRVNENVSLIEISRLQSLFEKQDLATLAPRKQMTRNTKNSKSSRHCNII
ncbi:unnamed protein product [Rotaria socialis]|nr:unnamed protein product [Rotaria socialis]